MKAILPTTSDTQVDNCLRAELDFAREYFPSSQYLLAALVEEVGELSQALIDHARGDQTQEKVFEEAIQVAAMAIRVAMEGDLSFPYRMSRPCLENFPLNRSPKRNKGDVNGITIKAAKPARDCFGEERAQGKAGNHPQIAQAAKDRILRRPRGSNRIECESTAKQGEQEPSAPRKEAEGPTLD